MIRRKSHHKTVRRLATSLALATLLFACGCTRSDEDAGPVPQKAGPAPGGEISVTADVVRLAGESVVQLATRVIPEGTRLAFDPAEIACGPPGSSLVILFRKSDSLSNYTDWVLHPVAVQAGAYRKVILPPLDEAPGLFDITVKSVFAAETGRPTGPDLIVLYEYYRTGSGTDHGYASYTYIWNGSSFEIDEQAGRSVMGLASESAVRTKLRSLKR